MRTHVDDQIRFVPATCDELVRALHDAFDAEFQLWSTAAQVTPAAKANLFSGLEVATHIAQASIEAALASNKTQIEQVTAETVLLAMPLPRRSEKPIVATAVFASCKTDHMLQLSRQFLRAHRAETKLADFEQERDLLLDQVTADFEELSLLRTIAELLTISEMTWDIANVANSILPRLQYCVAARQVTLIPLDEHDGEPVVGSPVTSSGQNVICAKDCTTLVERCLDQMTGQPLVVNGCANSLEYAKYPKLRNFVLVPLTRSQTTFDWLLAVNRHSTGYDSPGEPDGSKNLCEFGTRQATLLASAASILATHASNVELFRTKEQLFTDLVRALVRAIEAKDRYTCGHSERVALYARQIGRALDLPAVDCQRVYLSGLLHDVGKINIPESILLNPRRLTDEEFAEMKRHPDHGWGILQGLEGLRDVLNGVVYHHERWDGAGYPDGLAAKDIPLDSRILAVADAFDAMTSDRPYRSSMPLEKSLAILRDGAGSQWDPDIIDSFMGIQPAIAKIRAGHKLRDSVVRAKNTTQAEPAGSSADANHVGAVPGLDTGSGTVLPMESTMS